MLGLHVCGAIKYNHGRDKACNLLFLIALNCGQLKTSNASTSDTHRRINLSLISVFYAKQGTY